LTADHRVVERLPGCKTDKIPPRRRQGNSQVESIELSPFAFGGAAGTSRAKGGSNENWIADRIVFFGWGEVLGELGDKFGTYAGCRRAQHLQGAGNLTAPSHDQLAGLHFAGWFAGFAVQFYVPGFDTLGREGSGFVKAHGPKPLVETHIKGSGQHTGRKGRKIQGDGLPA
jgi:hypothetical protein